MTGTVSSLLLGLRIVESLWGRFAVLLLSFLAINLLAAHQMSDCGLPAVLGVAGCNDDIVRIGWPLKFYEQGGLAFHSFFSLSTLAGDIGAGVVGALLLALGSMRLRVR